MSTWNMLSLSNLSIGLFVVGAVVLVVALVMKKKQQQ